MDTLLDLRKCGATGRLRRSPNGRFFRNGFRPAVQTGEPHYDIPLVGWLWKSKFLKTSTKLRTDRDLRLSFK